MCVYSAIMEYGKNRIPVEQWNSDMMEHFKKLLERAQAFDKVASQPDCEDIAKRQYFEQVEKAIAAKHYKPPHGGYPSAI